jgi:hypothetical protein
MYVFFVRLVLWPAQCLRPQVVAFNLFLNSSTTVFFRNLAYIYIYIYIYISIYIHTHTYTYISTYRHVCMHIYIFTFMHTHTHTHVDTCIHTYGQICVYTFAYIHNMDSYCYHHVVKIQLWFEKMSACIAQCRKSKSRLLLLQNDLSDLTHV